MKLYIVGTPIGNLEDISLRALRVLREADLILCEDTRVTKKLLERHGIKTPTLSYHSHSKISKIDKIIALLEEGKTLALVSDAGTPGIQDPGSLLVSKVREELPDAEILAVPGPSALTAALSVAGVPASDFLFLGFLPHKKGREKLFKEIADAKRTVVFYESPHRILKALKSLQQNLPAGRKVLLARELTKIYEEVVSGTAKELIKQLEGGGAKIKGEFVVMVPTGKNSV